MKMDSLQSCKIFLIGDQKDATWRFFIISIMLCIVKKIPDNNNFLRNSFTIIFCILKDTSHEII